MELTLFVIFGAVAVASAFMVIVSRNPVVSALFLILTFFCLAGLYVLLNAQFIAALQIIVYAGAIMVLFVFVVMLLRTGKEARRGYRLIFQKSIGIIFVVLFLLLLGSITLMVSVTGMRGPYTAEAVRHIGNTQAFASVLFTDYLYPFEIISVLLLAGIIGAVVLAKRKR
ncbi:NADH-quinone oxidoreductase subunit J [bacterium (candidate division B38) B3_B38]|nr:MAG: NADH-quinone oxidoreductase subunit J [bacterium (candidate division B38) B3_B38]